MSIENIISLTSIGLLYISSLIGFWINIKIKVNEIEIKMKSIEVEISENKKDILLYQKNNTNLIEKEKNEVDEKIKLIDKHIEKVKNENLEGHKEILNRMDIFLSNFADFRVYVEQQFNKGGGK